MNEVKGKNLKQSKQAGGHIVECQTIEQITIMKEECKKNNQDCIFELSKRMDDNNKNVERALEANILLANSIAKLVDVIVEDRKSKPGDK